MDCSANKFVVLSALNILGDNFSNIVAVIGQDSSGASVHTLSTASVGINAKQGIHSPFPIPYVHLPLHPITRQQGGQHRIPLHSSHKEVVDSSEVTPHSHIPSAEYTKYLHSLLTGPAH